MALGEHRRHWPDLAHMVFVKVATGIGAGIISGGELLRGNHGRAGDIGHIRALRPSDVMCTCGNRGCVAVLATGAAVVRQLGEAGIEVGSTAEIVELVNAGDAVAMHHVREAGRVLGAALAGRRQRRRAERDRRRRRAGRRLRAADRRHPRGRLQARLVAGHARAADPHQPARATAPAWSA